MCAERLALGPIVDRCRSGEDGFDCSRVGAAYRVRLWGGLPDGWAGNFALHAFALGLEIASGEADRIDATRWAAAFTVRSVDRGGVARHDFLHMARRAPRVVPPLPEPDVEIAWSEANDGSNTAVCHVTGTDAIGLLAHVLRQFDALGLRPCEFSIRTNGDAVDDWFRLERREPHAVARRDRRLHPHGDDRLGSEGRPRWINPRSSQPVRSFRRALATARSSSREKTKSR